MKNVAYFGFSVAREISHRPGEILIRRPKICAQEMGLEVKALFPMDSWSLQFPAAHGAITAVTNREQDIDKPSIFRGMICNVICFTVPDLPPQLNLLNERTVNQYPNVTHPCQWQLKTGKEQLGGTR